MADDFSESDRLLRMPRHSEQLRGRRIKVDIYDILGVQISEFVEDIGVLCKKVIEPKF